MPVLLRRVADLLEGIEGADVLDLVLHDVAEHPCVTVYYTLPDDR